MDKKYIILEQQSIFDLSIQLGGSIENAAELLRKNNIEGFNGDLVVNNVFLYEEQNNIITNTFRDRATGVPGTSFDLPGAAFSNGFNNGFSILQ